MIPKSLAGNFFLFPTAVSCTAGNGNPFQCHGELTALFTFPLFRTEFQWTFLFPEVSTPLLGIYFLHHYNLFFDCGLKLILGSSTTLNAPIRIQNGSVTSLIFNKFTQHPVVTQPLKDFPSLTSPVNTLNHNNESRISIVLKQAMLLLFLLNFVGSKTIN